MMNYVDLFHHVNRLQTSLAPMQQAVFYTQALIGDYKYSSRSNDSHGWLVCDGRSLDSSEYAGLYSVIGTSFGGSGSSFKLPDFRGRVPGIIGSGSNLTARVLGTSVGEENHVLTIDEMPSHNHGGVTGSGGFGTGVATPAVSATTTDVADDGGSHTHAISAQGGGLAHNTMQPTLFGGNIMIFAGLVPVVP